MDEPSIDAKIEALARTQHGAIARRQVLELGASTSLIDRRVRGRRWIKCGHGVYLLAGYERDRTFKQRVMIAVLQCGQGAFASHECAALLRALDGVSTAAVEVTVPRRLRAKPKGVRIRYSTDATVFDWSEHDGIPTATATRIIIDLAADARVSLDRLERIFESAQRRRETSKAAVEEALERVARPGKPGIKRGRLLIAYLVDDGHVNHSEMETRFFQIMRAEGLPLPDRQQVVHRPDGRFAYADYAYPDTDGLVELLGFKWHSSSKALTSNAERSNDVLFAGKKTVYFTWEHITKRRDYVVRTMERFLRDIRVEYRASNAQE